MGFVDDLLNFIFEQFGIEAEVLPENRRPENLVMKIPPDDYIQVMFYGEEEQFYLSWAMQREKAERYLPQSSIHIVEFDNDGNNLGLEEGFWLSENQEHIAVKKENLRSIPSFLRNLDEELLWHIVIGQSDSVELPWVKERIKLFFGPYLAEDAGSLEPDQVLCMENRILRDTTLSRRIKELHNNKCQICDKRLPFLKGRFYSEAHHIKPLGKPHGGPDTAGNIIVVCPNHHVELDYGCIEIKLEDIRQEPNHQIDLKLIQYHNDSIYKYE